MGYNLNEDCRAARVLDSLLYEASIEGRYMPLRELCRQLSGSTVCIAGGSSSLSKSLRLVEACDHVVAADGAAGYLLSNALVPQVVVTDLDGSWQQLLEASSKGSAVVVHGHGDNIHALRFLVPRLQAVAGTVQCPHEGMFTEVVGGFTDGDRALFLVLKCGASTVLLVGMDTVQKTGAWSKPWLTEDVPPWPEKLAKLKVAEALIDLAQRASRTFAMEAAVYRLS